MAEAAKPKPKPKSKAKPKHSCKGAAKHRAAQNRYVAKNPERQRKRVAAHGRKNADKIAAAKKRARKRKGKGGGSKRIGRPRKC